MFRYVRSLLVLGMVAAGLFVTAPSAFAGRVHVFASTFGEEGSGPGQLREPSGVAVNEVTLGSAGDVYVVDQGNGRVEWFASEGAELKGELNGAATPAKSFSAPSAIAIDNSTNPLDPSRGDVYVADTGHNVIDKFTAEGTYLSQITTGKEGAPLGVIYGLAVDPEGSLWIFQENHEIDSYSDALANILTSSTESPFGTAPGFAVDSEDHLYVNRGVHRIGKLSSTGGELIEAINAGENASAVATNSSNEVFIDEDGGENPPANAGITTYDSEANTLEQFAQGHLSGSRGLAVDSTRDIVYATNSATDTVAMFPKATLPTTVTGEATGLENEGQAILNGTVDPEEVEVSECRFEYGLNREYGQSAECASPPGEGTGPVAVTAAISELEFGRYHYRLVARNANGEAVGADHVFEALGKPVISGETAAAVGVTTTQLDANLNFGGLETTYQVQYGTTPAYGLSSPPETATGFATGIEIDLESLQGSSKYHARIIATNARGTSTGQDIAFVTRASSVQTAASDCPNRSNSGFSAGLPDCRAYEAVSAGGGPGEVYSPEGPEALATRQEDVRTERPMRAAGAGDAVTYLAESTEQGGNGAIGKGLGNQMIATRDAASERWDVVAVSPEPADPEERGSNKLAYQAFSGDLSLGVFTTTLQSIEPLLPGPPSCNVLYARTAEGLRALFTETRTPGDLETACGLHKGAAEVTAPRNLRYVGTNAGNSTVPADRYLLFQSTAPLVAGAESSNEESDGTNLYESIAGATRLVSVLPDGAPDANAVFGSPAPPLESPANLPPGETRGNLSDFENVISADGSRIFWTDLTTGKIYMRLNSVSTVQISSGSAEFWGASADGRFILYTEGETLWRDDTEAPTGSQREELSGVGAGVQGVVGAGSDESYVYFVASGALAPGAEVRKCLQPHIERLELEEKEELTSEQISQLEADQRTELEGHLPLGRGCNLYVQHEGTTVFIAALGAADDAFERNAGGKRSLLGAWQGELGSRTAQVADDGRELVFESAQQLTGYDNSKIFRENLEHGRPGAEVGAEVFVYNTAADKLVCASCDPAGASPSPQQGSPQDRESQGPTYVPLSLNPTSMPRWVSEDGSRVFFNTSQPLVAQDANRRQDVYEWEREGTPGCPVPTAESGGCVSLLSGGDSSDLSSLIDASADGTDVFFTHRGALAGQGRHEGKTELFDVRVDGGFPQTSTACTGSGCQGVPGATPSFATPASATFSGSGNYSPSPPPGHKSQTKTRSLKLAHALRKCRQIHAAKKRRACERRARQRYGPKTQSKQSSSRPAGRKKRR